MALGKRKTGRQQEFWVQTEKLQTGPAHIFYDRLNKLLAEIDFDERVEQLCAPYYADNRGRPGIPPGVFFRMIFIGYFEGLNSHRGIAWRCQDSLSLRRFLGIPLEEKTPDHSSVSRIHRLLDLPVFEAVFAMVLELAQDHKLLKGKSIGVDSTFVEANAAMKSIVRKDSGEDWKQYIITVMRAEGLLGEDEEPSDDELRRFDKSRKNKKVSNQDWQSETDEDARIMRMKNGTTHLAYKAEHAVDLETEVVVHAEIYHADDHDTKTLEPTLDATQQQLTDVSDAQKEIKRVVADCGYHSVETIADLTVGTQEPVETYIPEKKLRGPRNTDNLARYEIDALERSQKNQKSKLGQKLQRARSHLVEQSFAHLCDTGGTRRMHLRGLEQVNKRYKLVTAARNLGSILRKIFGLGKPRSGMGWQALRVTWKLLFSLSGRQRTANAPGNRLCFAKSLQSSLLSLNHSKWYFTTGC